MPRRSVLLISLVLSLTLSTSVYAEDSGIYVGGIAGLTFRPDTTLSSPILGSQEIDFRLGYSFGGFVGYDFGNNFRLEGEISYRENDIRSGGVGEDPQAAASSIMLNGFYALPSKNRWNFYIGGGFGAATAQLETISLGQIIDAHETVFAYQLEAGVDWHYNSKASLGLGYRFFDAADPEFLLSTGQRVRMEMETHELLLKMRYLFNL